MPKIKIFILFLLIVSLSGFAYYIYQSNQHNKIVKNSNNAFDSGAFSLAIKIAETGLISNSDDASLLNIKGRAHSHLNESDTAIELFSKSLKIKPNQNEIQLELSECYVKKSLDFFVYQKHKKDINMEANVAKNLKQAEILIDSILKADQSNRRALNNKGLIEQIYFEQKKENFSEEAVSHLDEALKSFRLTYQTEPIFVEGLVNQAILLYTLKKNRESEQLFLKSAKAVVDVYEKFKKQNKIPNQLTEDFIKNLAPEIKVTWLKAQGDYSLQFQKILFFLDRIYVEEQNYSAYLNVLDFQISIHDLKWQSLLLRQQLAENFKAKIELTSDLKNEFQKYQTNLENEVATYKKQLPERIFKIYLGKAECYSQIKDTQKAIALYQQIIDQSAKSPQYKYYLCKASLLLVQIQLAQANLSKDEKTKYINLFKSLPNPTEPQLQYLKAELQKKYLSLKQ